MPPTPPDRLRRIRWLLCDVDGVLTPGRLAVDPAGGVSKEFHVHDGHRIRLAIANGLPVGLVTGRGDPCVLRRAADLRLDPVLVAQGDKVETVTGWLAQATADWSELAYIGDDLPDQSLLARVGLSIAPADAAWPVRARVDWVTRAAGGTGAVAEVLDHLLAGRGGAPQPVRLHA